MAVMRSASTANDVMASLLYSTYVRWFHRKSNLSIIFYGGAYTKVVHLGKAFVRKESNCRMIKDMCISHFHYPIFILFQIIFQKCLMDAFNSPVLN